MAILSIQSAVAVGYVGNAAAVPALQSLGYDVWRVDTVMFSNHPGHGRFAGDIHPARKVIDLIEGIGAHGKMGDCEAVLSGYLGEAETASAVELAVNALRCTNPKGLYVLDPVIGDHGRIFVRDGVLDAIRDRLLPLANIVLPNPSELGWLTGTTIKDTPDALDAARLLLDSGPDLVVVTGVEEGGEMAVYAVTDQAIWRAATCRRDRHFNGTGDLFAALFTGWITRSGDPGLALAATVACLDRVIGETTRRGTEELALIPVLADLARTGEHAPAAQHLQVDL